MPDLADFQDAFAASLTGDPPPDAPAGLSVYRNTIAQGLIEVLATAYPTVQRLMGEGWFASEALAFSRAHPPVNPVLAKYGADFPAWLASPPREAGEENYIAQAARIDRAWLEAHNAADAAPLEQPDFERVPTPHPAARLLAFDLPAVTLWRLNRPPAPVLAEPIAPGWVPQACLVSRPHDAVMVTELDADSHDFLAACFAGATLGEAAVALLARRPEADLAGLFARLLAAGAFAEPLV